MARSTCIRIDAICLPFFTSSAGNSFRPSRKGGMFKSTLISCSMSLIVNPRSAIIDIPFLPYSFWIKPDTRVSSTSEIRLQRIVLLPIRIFYSCTYNYSIIRQANYAIDSGFLKAILIVVAALSDTSGRAEGSSTESSSGHHVVVLQLFVDIPVTPMSAAGFWRLQHLTGHQTMFKPQESPPLTLAMRESSSSPNLARVSSTVCSNWLPPCTEWQEQLEVLSQRDVTQTPPRTCCERADVITSQRDTLPPNIWLPFFSSNRKFTNE